MDWDDEYDNGYDDVGHTSHSNNSLSNNGSSEGGFDPMNIANPVSAYFFLSDDAQDEITGEKRKNMKCGSCGHRFTGESYESCPKCYSINTDEVVAGIDGKEENMKCLDCGHTFVGETYESCPECFSLDTEELENEPY
jgi:Zn finger protein HypA/HybF involved in hydrogenase expression